MCTVLGQPHRYTRLMGCPLPLCYPRGAQRSSEGSCNTLLPSSTAQARFAVAVRSQEFGFTYANGLSAKLKLVSARDPTDCGMETILFLSISKTFKFSKLEMDSGTVMSWLSFAFSSSKLVMLPSVEGSELNTLSERSRIWSFASIVSGAGNSGILFPTAFIATRCLHFANSMGKYAILLFAMSKCVNKVKSPICGGSALSLEKKEECTERHSQERTKSAQGERNWQGAILKKTEMGGTACAWCNSSSRLRIGLVIVHGGVSCSSPQRRRIIKK